MHWIPFSLLFLACCLLLSCGTSHLSSELKNPPSPIAFDKINSDSVYNRISANQSIPFLMAKGRAKFMSNKESVEGKLTLYGIKDSMYLIIIKKLGIELSRILITKDSFKILDRINETYSANAMDEFTEKFNIPLDFQSIHQLLTTACFMDSNIYYEFKKDRKNCSLHGYSEYQILNYKLDTMRLLPYSFEAQFENRDLYIEVQKSMPFSGKWIPVNYEITATHAKDEFLKIQINWDEIKLEPFASVRFVVPDYYKTAGE